MCFTFLRINWLLREEKDLRFVVTARRQIEDIALLPSNMKDINIFDKYFYRIIRYTYCDSAFFICFFCFCSFSQLVGSAWLGHVVACLEYQV